MMDARLRTVCLWIAAFAGITSLSSILFPPVRAILFPATIFVGGTAVLLFAKILFSRTYLSGLGAANRQMRGDAPWPGRQKSVLDPEWGVFGSRGGSPALLWVRLCLLVGLLLVAFLSNWVGTDVVALQFAGFFVAMELSLMHVALSQGR